MQRTLTHSPQARLRILPLARRLLGAARPDTPYLLELLAILAMQRNAARAEDFKTALEYNRYCRKRCREVTELRAAFTRFNALPGRSDADLMEANVQKALAIQPWGEGWTVTYTPTQGSTLRTAIVWLVERACVNREHRLKQQRRETDRAFFARHNREVKAQREQARTARQQALVDAYNARIARETAAYEQAQANTDPTWPFDFPEPAKD